MLYFKLLPLVVLVLSTAAVAAAENSSQRVTAVYIVSY